jgi:two-component system, OmpR family, sensor histidine kinase CiaH
MSIFRKKRLVIATIAYWLLLLYTLAALIFWFIELESQNQRMTNYKLQELKQDDPGFLSKVNTISLEEHRKTAQYIGEGSIFLVVILIGAIFLYRAVLRQIRTQEQQQNFMMAITHELKTPIAVTKLNLETLQKFKLEESKYQRIIQTALKETDRLNTMANNILVSAQLEGGRYQMSSEELDFSALVTNAVNEFKNRFPEKKWEVNISPDLSVSGDILLLQILVNNLLENAAKYSPRESMVSASLTKENRQIILQIKDQGQGIPAPEKRKIFRKFYRIGREETRTAQGTGLGLYLCEKIAADHHARIQVSDNYPAGTNFTIQFPLTD